MDDEIVLVQLLYTNGFYLKTHNTCLYLNSLHLKKKKKEEDTLNPFLSFIRISNFFSNVQMELEVGCLYTLY